MMLNDQMTYLGSGLAGCGCGCGGSCESGGLSDAITSEYATVRITGRKPEAGMPPAGAPFSIEVEVQTYKTGGPSVFRTPFACLDAFVVVRGLYQYENKILGSGFVRTSVNRNCRGSATITLAGEFRPGDQDWVQLELYEGGSVEWFQGRTTVEDVEEGRLDPIAVSDPIRFNQSQQELIEAGVIQEESVPFSVLQPVLEGMRDNVWSIAGVLGMAAGGYLIIKNADAISTLINRAVKS